MITFGHNFFCFFDDDLVLVGPGHVQLVDVGAKSSNERIHAQHPHVLSKLEMVKIWGRLINYIIIYY